VQPYTLQRVRVMLEGIREIRAIMMRIAYYLFSIQVYVLNLYRVCYYESARTSKIKCGNLDAVRGIAPR